MADLEFKVRSYYTNEPASASPDYPDGSYYVPYYMVGQSDAPTELQEGFWSFCLERDNHTLNNRIYWATIDDVIRNKPTGGGSLNEEVKKIYAAFRNGAYDGYSSNMIPVQNAIWAAETGTLSSGQQSEFLNSSLNFSGWERVKALNLWGLNSNGSINYNKDIQSQLMMTQVPIPSALLLGSIGLGVASWRMKKRKVC